MTSKLEGMLNDLDASRLVSVKWANYLNGRGGGALLGVPDLESTSPEEQKISQSDLEALARVGKSSLDFTVTVLTTGHWPNFVNPSMRLPAEVLDHMALFKLFYNRSTQHKMLTF